MRIRVKYMQRASICIFHMRMRLETCEYVHVNMCVLMYVVCVDEYAV